MFHDEIVVMIKFLKGMGRFQRYPPGFNPVSLSVCQGLQWISLFEYDSTSQLFHSSQSPLLFFSLTNMKAGKPSLVFARSKFSQSHFFTVSVA